MERINITLKTIKNIVSNYRSFNQIQYINYYHEMRQMIMTWNEEKGYYEILALFERWNDTHTVLLQINRQRISYSCNCLECDNYSACAHVGAVLLYLKENYTEMRLPFVYDLDRLEIDIEEWKKYYSYSSLNELDDYIQECKNQRERDWIESQLSRTNQLLNHKKNIFLLQDKIIASEKNVDLFLNFSVPMERYYKEQGVYYLMDIKIGNSRPYVIRNVRDFLWRINHEKTYEYGKLLNFEHRLENFTDDGKKVAEMLMKMDFYTSSDQRFVLIQKENLDQLYDTLKSLENANLYNLSLENKPLKAELTISPFTMQNQELYRINAKETNLISTTNYRYQRNALTLTRYGNEKSKNVMEVLQLLEEELILNKEQLNEFSQMYLTTIEDCLKIKGMDTALVLPTKENYLFYADLNDQNEVSLLSIVESNGIEHYLFDTSWENRSLLTMKIENWLRSTVDYIDETCNEARVQEEHAIPYAQDILPLFNQFGKVYISDRLKRISTAKTLSLQAGVRIEAGLLHVNFKTEDLDGEELTEILRSYRKKKRYHLLKDGSVVDLENSVGLKEYEKMNRQLHLEDFDRFNGEYLLDASMALRFEAFDDFEQIKLERDQSYRQLIENFNHQESHPLPESYNTILRNYQKSGYYWLKKLEQLNLNGILADDMGLGKTLQVIALLDSSRKKGRHSLVVCPSSLLYNWQKEVAKFSDTLTCQIISGTATLRKERIDKINEYDLSIITYDILKRDIDAFNNQEFYYVILDEAQYIKNQRTKNAFSVKQLQAVHRLALTGTPIENTLAELWSIFDFLMPKFLFNYHYFQNTYEKPIVQQKDEEISRELKKLVEPFILRRTKKEVLKELPEKVETLYTIDFSEKEWNLYVANLSLVNKDLKEQLKMDNVDRFQVLAMLTKLRQICCDPKLVFENYEEERSKLNACLSLIETLVASNKKILLFSSFTTVLDTLKEELEKMNIACYTLKGSTSKEDRYRLTERFQIDDTPVFLISLKAGGTGLNLTAAEAVIHYDPWWNSSAQNQATDRAYRIGQKNMVSVYNLIMKDSIEEKIVRLQEKKKNLADVFVEDSQGSIAKMSQEEILNLFELPEK